jgi:hypothetical protein
VHCKYEASVNGRSPCRTVLHGIDEHYQRADGGGLDHLRPITGEMVLLDGRAAGAADAKARGF